MNLEEIKKKLDENEILFSKKSSKLNIIITIILMILSCIIGYYSIANSKEHSNYIFVGIWGIYLLFIISRLIYKRLHKNLVENEYKITRELLSQVTDKEDLKKLKDYCDYKLSNLGRI